MVPEGNRSLERAFTIGFLIAYNLLIAIDLIVRVGLMSAGMMMSCAVIGIAAFSSIFFRPYRAGGNMLDRIADPILRSRR